MPAGLRLGCPFKGCLHVQALRGSGMHHCTLSCQNTCASTQVPSQGNKGVGMCSACTSRLNLDMCSPTGIAANMTGTPTASPSGGAVRRASHLRRLLRAASAGHGSELFTSCQRE